MICLSTYRGRFFGCELLLSVMMFYLKCVFKLFSFCIKLGLLSCQEKKLEWGKGLAQKRKAEERLQELELEKDRPFARTRWEDFSWKPAFQCHFLAFE